MKTHLRRNELRTRAARYIRAVRRDLQRVRGEDFSRGRIAGAQAILNLMGEISLEAAVRLPVWMYRKTAK